MNLLLQGFHYLEYAGGKGESLCPVVKREEERYQYVASVID